MTVLMNVKRGVLPPWSFTRMLEPSQELAEAAPPLDLLPLQMQPPGRPTSDTKARARPHRRH